ncbi:outer membrane protein TolC [Thermoflavifilum aggregans]|uniref:Outer membrane protein TolC n=1 Tax=Thermoflavifilum aggregans TaxID=454188 RepID=A0A2M9CW89_9BACT|nr:TolC family protein [Thermoflavifilum aggregans]PJJ76176.1 outer membrane protein TolC [Thermoflavifilum aggregans]
MIKILINKQKSKWLIGILLIFSLNALAQQYDTLNLDECLEMAKRNYPLIKQYALIEKTKEYSIANAQKGYLPQFNIAGQATYQSDVTKIPISLPGIDIPIISRDQYKIYGEVSQSITDLFTVKDQKEYINTNSEIETQKTEIELYKLRERINNLYFGILIINAQIQQIEILKKDIQNGIEQTNIAISNGVALKSAADNLKAELLKANQQTIELKYTRKSYADMLSLYIGKQIDENTVLEMPMKKILSTTINRPELKQFDLQKKSFDIQNKLINDKNLPRLSVFFQVGLGRPGLNMLNNNFKGYYIGGLRLNWNFTSLYTLKNEREILALNQSAIDVQRETLLFNTNLTLKQQYADITKMEELIETDKSIVELREKIKNTILNQLTNGTATTNDYIISVNAVEQAKLNLVLHEIQLLMTEYNIQTTTGNQ